MATEKIELNEDYEKNMVQYFKNKGDGGAIASSMFLASVLVRNNYQSIELSLEDFTDEKVPDTYTDVEIIVRVKMPWYKRFIKQIKEFILKPHTFTKSYTGTQANYLAKK